ncbi:MAG: hypothetical protein ACE366_10885 [Bradymonadia bacterium]
MWKSVVCGVCALLLLSGSALAEDVEFQAPEAGSIRLTIRPTGARLFDDGVAALSADKHLAGGDLAVGYRLFDALWLEANWVIRAAPDTVYGVVETQLEVNDLRANVMWHVLPDGWMRPYLKAGAGRRFLHTAWSAGGSRVAARDQAWMVQGAAGLELLGSLKELSESFGMGLSLEMGYEQSGAMSLARDGVEMGQLNTSALVWSAGVVFQF